MKFIINPENKTIHTNPPHGKCNIPTARKEGETGTKTVNFSAATLLRWEEGFRTCDICFEEE